MKNLGVALWVAAFSIFIVDELKVASSFMQSALFAVIFIQMPHQLYSWVWGVHKGQLEHLICIAGQLIFAVAVYYMNSLPVALFAGISMTYVVVTALAALNLRRRFPENFRKKQQAG